MRQTQSSHNSTSAVLWLMIMLVFLPIAIGHVLARQSGDSSARAGAVQEQSGPHAG